MNQNWKNWNTVPNESTNFIPLVDNSTMNSHNQPLQPNAPNMQPQHPPQMWQGGPPPMQPQPFQSNVWQQQNFNHSNPNNWQANNFGGNMPAGIPDINIRQSSNTNSWINDNRNMCNLNQSINGNFPLNDPPINQHSNVPGPNTFQSTVQKCSDDVPDRYKIWIETWITKVNCKSSSPKLSSSLPTKLSEAIEDIKKHKNLIEQLKLGIELLVFCNDEEKYKFIQDKIKKLQEEIDILHTNFKNPHYVKAVQYLTKKRRMKRLRLKKQRTLNYLKKKEAKEKWKIKDLKIDNWRNSIILKEKKKRDEINLKKETDLVLSEIRKKIQDTENMINVLKLIKKLREARLRKGDVHGFSSTVERTNNFNAGFAKLNKLLKVYEEEYKKEQETMITVWKESASSRQAVISNRKVDKHCKSMHRILFNSESSLDDYNEKSIEDLIAKRYEWDNYICETNSPLASSVPLGWVVPPSYPDSNWKCYQNNKF